VDCNEASRVAEEKGDRGKGRGDVRDIG